ncbi:MAG: polysaccharide deacetylase family protein [Myxococcota bacterium]
MRRLTLSFDNGPDPACTPGVLDVIAAHGVRASFFVCGRGNRLHPALRAERPEARRILERARAEGHWIGNHTLTHTVELGTTDDPEVIEREIGGNDAVLGELNDRRLFRPYAGGGVLCERTFSPAAIRYLCDGGYTTVLFDCVPRDWEDPQGWPETALADVESRDWTLLVVHDVARYGGMRQLDRFLSAAEARGVELVQEFPPDCVPIRGGEVVGSLEGLVCGDTPEPVQPLSAAAADHVEGGP